MVDFPRPNTDANDEAGTSMAITNSLHRYHLSPLMVLVCSSEAEFSSQSETLSLPWVGKKSNKLVEVHNPTVIETSRWAKIVMLKACKAFGVNITGFELEILDMILHMEHTKI